MRKQETRPLKDVLSQALEEAGLAEAVKIGGIHKAWERVVGPQAAAQCKYNTFEDGVYKVKVGSAVLRSRLNMQKPMLLSRMNAQLGRALVTDLVIY